MSRLIAVLTAATAISAGHVARAECTFSWKAESGDTCKSMSSDWGVTEQNFIRWNPSVGENCKNGVKPGVDYCVEYKEDAGVTSTTSSPTVTKTTIVTSTTTNDPLRPSPTQTGITSDCKKFYKLERGLYCQDIVDKFGTFTLDDFYSWNPAVGDDCSHLFPDYYYCVGVSGTPTTRPTTTSDPVPTPHQTGIVSNCQKFYKAVSTDSCQGIVDKYGAFSLDDFYKWNPAVGSQCNFLIPDNYYCVGVPGTPDRPTSTKGTGPSPTQSGIAKNCKQFYKVKSGDYCQKIVDNYQGRFTLQQFYSWNPAVGSNCQFLQTNYYVCVGV